MSFIIPQFLIIINTTLCLYTLTVWLIIQLKSFTITKETVPYLKLLGWFNDNQSKSFSFYLFFGFSIFRSILSKIYVIIYHIRCCCIFTWWYFVCCSCVGLKEYLVGDIDKYHCPRCVHLFGPSVCKYF